MTNTITVTGTFTLDEDVFFNIEWTDEEGTICTEKIAEETMDRLIHEGLTSWVCVDEDAMKDFRRVIKSNDIKYYELDENADGSGEHDLYEHRAYVNADGEVVFDKHGSLIKTYKQLASARKALAKLQK